MPAVTLPDRPDLGHLRNQARKLQRAVRRADPEAVKLVARHAGPPADPARFTLSAAQLVVAREIGFPSWARLKHYFDVVARYRWDPAEHYPSVPDRFCVLACLTYAEDGPARWAAARAILDANPGLVRASIWAAAAAVDVAAVRAQLAADGRLARRRGGPNRWQPLFYLVYSRLDPQVPADAVLEIARLLLAAGADPDEGYLWHGLPTPFTLLTGALGGGERDQPPHPHWPALCRLLLDAGADPNDGQGLYNRMFRPDSSHLELLLPAGLGTGDGGVWRTRLGGALDTPADLLRRQLRWAIEHALTERVQLLVRYGVDLRMAYEDGRTPGELARRAGNPALADYLMAHGAPALRPDPVDEFVGAALRADRPALSRLEEEHPGVPAAARQARPALILWAVARGLDEAVELLAGYGFDVNALGRGDTPATGESETALHGAAARGDVALVHRLLRLGADPDIQDARFGATPLGWARHFGRREVAALLEPLTAPAPET